MMPFILPVIPICFSVNAITFGKNEAMEIPNTIVPIEIVKAEPGNSKIIQIPVIAPIRSAIRNFSGMTLFDNGIDISRPIVIDPQKNEVIIPAVLLLEFSISFAPVLSPIFTFPRSSRSLSSGYCHSAASFFLSCMNSPIWDCRFDRYCRHLTTLESKPPIS